MRLVQLGLLVSLLLLAGVLLNRETVSQAPARADAGFTYGASVTAHDRATIEQAVASARPEAQRLIGLVDGMTRVEVGPAGGAAGSATDMGDRYELQLDLDVARPMGPRGISRLVLHELGHVVDFALLDDAMLEELNTSIPAGWVCEEGNVGSCAEKEERFAETFAKWATGDIGVDIYLGYKVPPPSVPLDTWGAPLSGLGA